MYIGRYYGSLKLYKVTTFDQLGASIRAQLIIHDTSFKLLRCMLLFSILYMWLEVLVVYSKALLVPLGDHTSRHTKFKVITTLEEDKR